MKYLFFIITLCFIFSFSLIDPISVDWSVPLIIALIVAIYEVFARLIPSIQDWTFIGRFIDILKIISDYLNKRKKKR